jgi:hypothetical protein
MAWKPIETAPKDGTSIFIIGNDLGLDCLSYCAAFWDNDGAWHNDIDGSVFPEYYEPTHWQPLPEPPTNQTQVDTYTTSGGE